MKRELTKEEIDLLFDFTRKHYVKFYDVQVELVDHLASAVEAEWDKKPELSFNEALNNVFSDFGIFGFDGIEAQKANAVIKQQAKLWKQNFIDLLKWPNAVLILLIYLLVFQLFNNFQKDAIALGLSLIIIIVNLCLLASSSIYLKRNLTKKLVLTQQRFFYLSYCNIPLYIHQFFGFWFYKQGAWLLATIFSILILLIYAYTITSKKIIAQAKSQYPEAFKIA